MLSGPASPSSVLALATTIHLSLALLRKHRQHAAGPVNAAVFVSFALAALPWMFPSPLGICVGLGAQVAWFFACERLLAPALATAAVTSRSVAQAAPARAPAISAAHSSDVAAGPARRPIGFVAAPVIAAFDETPDIKTFRVLRPEGFDFEAGQFVAVRIRVDGKDYVRCYSISSAPAATGYLEMSVKRIGTVSNALHATVRPGAVLSIKAPAGSFRYPGGDDRPIVLLAGGIGITPLMSMVRHAVATEPTRPVTLIYSARTATSFAFRDELDWTARRHPQVRVHYASGRDGKSTGVHRGRIDQDLLQTVVPELVHSISFICGPEPMLDGMRSLLARMGVPPAQIRFEVFQAAVAAASAAEPEGARAKRGVARRKKSSTAHSMRCTRSGADVPLRPGETLLEAVEKAGVGVPSLCRAGVCGTCRLQVTSGDVNCESTVLAPEERQDGFVLACVTTANSDCTVEI